MQEQDRVRTLTVNIEPDGRVFVTGQIEQVFVDDGKVVATKPGGFSFKREVAPGSEAMFAVNALSAQAIAWRDAAVAEQKAEKAKLAEEADRDAKIAADKAERLKRDAEG